MAPQHRELGAVSAEYVAGAVIVAAMITALWASGTAQLVGEHARVAACNLFATEERCEVELAAADAAATGTDPASGGAPPGTPTSPVADPDVLPEGPIDVGSGSPGGSGTTVTVTRTEELTDHLDVQTSLTDSASRRTLDMDGCVRQTLGVELSTRITASADVPIRERLQVGLEGYAGTSTGVNVTVTEEHADRIRRDPRQAPNPFKPLEMPVGSAVELTSEAFAGYGMEVAYRQLLASLDESVGKEVSLGVVRLEGGGIRLIAGEADLVRRAIELGFGTENAHIKVGSTSEYRDARLEIVDIDITGADGYDSYLTALRTGRFPDTGQPGVIDRGRVQLNQHTGALIASAKLGPLSASIEGASTDASLETTTYSDGRVVESHSIRHDDVTVVVERDYARAGGTPTEERYTVLLQSVDPSSYRLLMEVQGIAVADVAGPQNVRIDFTEQQLLAIRDQAREGIDHLGRTPGSTLDRIAQAEDHLGVLAFFLETDMANPGSIIEYGLVGPASAASIARDDRSGVLDVHGDTRRFDPC